MSMIRIPVSLDVIEALIVAGRVDNAGSRDSNTVAAALADVQRQWARIWLQGNSRS